MADDIRLVKEALLGNPIEGGGGMKKRLENVEESTKKHELFITKVRTILWFIGASIAALGFIVKHFIDIIKTKP